MFRWSRSHKTFFAVNFLKLHLFSTQKNNDNIYNIGPHVSGIMGGAVAAIALLSVLFIVLKRNRRLPNAVRGSNPQTPTHVSFSTNIDNPPEIRAKCYKTFYNRNLHFVYIKLVIFPALSIVCA